MKISTAIFRQEAVRYQQPRVCSKKSVQSCPEASRREGRSPFCARSVLAVREHGKRARTPLAAFFNRPILENYSESVILKCFYNVRGAIWIRIYAVW